LLSLAFQPFLLTFSLSLHVVLTLLEPEKNYIHIYVNIKLKSLSTEFLNLFVLIIACLIHKCTFLDPLSKQRLKSFRFSNSCKIRHLSKRKRVKKIQINFFLRHFMKWRMLNFMHIKFLTKNIFYFIFPSVKNMN